MKLITQFELASMPTKEIHALYSKIFNALGCRQEGQERMNALVSLENIRNKIGCRTLGF